MIGELGRRSTAALLVHSTLIQALTFLLRPAATYRALELDVPGFALGLLAASYAVFPLLLARRTRLFFRVRRSARKARCWPRERSTQFRNRVLKVVPIPPCLTTSWTSKPCARARQIPEAVKRR